jgi:hypothetical protein
MCYRTTRRTWQHRLSRVADVASYRAKSTDSLSSQTAVSIYLDVLVVMPRVPVPRDQSASMREANARPQLGYQWQPHVDGIIGDDTPIIWDHSKKSGRASRGSSNYRSGSALSETTRHFSWTPPHQAVASIFNQVPRLSMARHSIQLWFPPWDGYPNGRQSLGDLVWHRSPWH